MDESGITIDFVQPYFSISDGTRLFGELFLGFFGLLAIIYAFWVARRRREIWPIIVVLTCPIILNQEVLSDILGRCAYALPGPGQSDHTAVTILGRQLPLYIFFGYFAYFAPVIWLVEKFEQGITKATFVKIFGLEVIGVILFEVPAVYFKWWIYYGENQPLDFWGHAAPAWWWFADSACLLSMAVGIYYARTRLFTKTWHNVLYIPLGLIMVAGGIHAAAIPMWVTIANDSSLLVTTIASFISIAMSLLIIWMLASLVCTDMKYPLLPSKLTKQNAAGVSPKNGVRTAPTVTRK